MPARLSPELERVLAGAQDAPLDVVLELQGPDAPEGGIEAAKEAFRAPGGARHRGGARPRPRDPR